MRTSPDGELRLTARPNLGKPGEELIARDDVEILGDGLSGDCPVEWISVLPSERSRRERVLVGDRQAVQETRNVRLGFVHVHGAPVMSVRLLGGLTKPNTPPYWVTVRSRGAAHARCTTLRVNVTGGVPRECAASTPRCASTVGHRAR